MERASKLIRGLGLPSDTISPEQIACAAWASAVGKKIASHTRAAKLVRTRLVVEVEDRDDSPFVHHISIRVCGLVHHTGHFGAHLRPALGGDAAACLHVIAEWNRENRDGEDRDRCGEASILAPSRMQCFFIELGFVDLGRRVRGFGLKILL